MDRDDGTPANPFEAELQRDLEDYYQAFDRYCTASDRLVLFLRDVFAVELLRTLRAVDGPATECPSPGDNESR